MDKTVESTTITGQPEIDPTANLVIIGDLLEIGADFIGSVTNATRYLK